MWGVIARDIFSGVMGGGFNTLGFGASTSGGVMAGDTISGAMGRGRESEGEVGMNGINDDDTDSLLDLSVEDSGVGIGGLGNTTGRDNIDVIGGNQFWVQGGKGREGVRGEGRRTACKDGP